MSVNKEGKTEYQIAQEKIIKSKDDHQYNNVLAVMFAKLSDEKKREIFYKQDKGTIEKRINRTRIH